MRMWYNDTKIQYINYSGIRDGIVAAYANKMMIRHIGHLTFNNHSKRIC